MNPTSLSDEPRRFISGDPRDGSCIGTFIEMVVLVVRFGVVGESGNNSIASEDSSDNDYGDGEAVMAFDEAVMVAIAKK